MVADTSTQPNKPSIGDYLKNNIREYGLLVALVVIMLFFQFVTNGVLFRPVNITNLVLQNSFIVIMALGMLLIIVAGHIDLSVGSIVAFIGAISAIMLVKWGLPAFVVIPACLVVGGIMGAAQGYWVAYQKIPSFIVTLAGMLVFRGLTYVVLGGRPIGPFPKEFQLLSTGFVPDFLYFLNPRPDLIQNMVALVAVLALVGYAIYAGVRNRRVNEQHGSENEPFVFFAIQMAVIAVVALFIGYQLSTYRGLPNVLIAMGVLIALYTFVTTRSTIGRRIYAMGGNVKAAKLSGINTERLTFYTFINMGVLAALAGMIITARLNSATPKAGQGFELDVIAACFIGGASASGGVGKIIGAVIGAFIMGVMNNGMSIMGIGIDYQQLIKGLVLLAAVFFDVYNKNKG
ncbi:MULTISPECIES: multiple monosaccharide ABC transporter permease [Ensifer]|jgi:putative multiple sugar transport system permease protein|uniref:Xylose transport system permease protein XylH n=1 Tax=Ensifer canadensis TaxID=555315 RepID=A0AAW4FHS7_9HYPH|nr:MULTISPECIES: multiple monosaccharide ABC transporter permease [Ensifer]AHK45145.1 ABC transporter (sugar), membrane spanning protein [Ensifer adhaerens OV14]MDP9630133.1 putative multiple sugar transport system permease protein [Ensifer adhaerens]KQU94509.1 ABC transporter permease [Ensifer sp. Root31]KQW46140.1 ABC transporter permease [Ensifer sp. Root1252]KQW83415.1 ABC transporter permease [Ensifer sp. Root127]